VLLSTLCLPHTLRRLGARARASRQLLSSIRGFRFFRVPREPGRLMRLLVVSSEFPPGPGESGRMPSHRAGSLFPGWNPRSSPARTMPARMRWRDSMPASRFGSCAWNPSDRCRPGVPAFADGFEGASEGQTRRGRRDRASRGMALRLLSSIWRRPWIAIGHGTEFGVRGPPSGR